jgi:hypothetical protein
VANKPWCLPGGVHCLLEARNVQTTDVKIIQNEVKAEKTLSDTTGHGQIQGTKSPN